MTTTLSQQARRGTLAVVCLATAMLMLDIAVVNNALPHVARDLHAGLTGVQWVVDAYTLALAAVVLSAGSLADRRGRRLVFAIGMTVFTVASLACAVANTIALLDTARAAQGIGGALLFSSSLALLADAFSGADERAGAMAAYGATIGGAFAVGPAVGGALTAAFGWRAVFFVNLPLGAIALLGTFAWTRESRDPTARRLDTPGQTTLTAGLFLLVLGLLRGNIDGWGAARTVAELAGAACLLLGFVVIELRAEQPMLELAMFRRRDFTAAQIVAFAMSAGFFAIYLYLTLYLQNVLHLTVLEAGLVYMPGTLLLFAASAVSSTLTARARPETLMIGGLGLVTSGLALLTITSPQSAWTVILPGHLLACLGTGLINPALATTVLAAGPEESSGLLAGANDAFRQAGIAVGVAVFGALVPAGAALGHGTAGNYVGGFHHALLVGAGIVAAGTLATTAVLQMRRSQIAQTQTSAPPATELA